MTGQPVSWFERVAVIAVGVLTATLVTVVFAVQGQGWGQLCPTALVIAVVVGLGLAWFLPWQSRRMARRHLAGRPPMDTATFGATFFSDLPRGPKSPRRCAAFTWAWATSGRWPSGWLPWRAYPSWPGSPR